jgi:BT1 family
VSGSAVVNVHHTNPDTSILSALTLHYLRTHHIAVQIPNAAWRSFLVEGLHFQPFELGLISIVGSLFSSIGLIAYKKFFMGTGWRKIYIVTSTLTCLFSIMQLLLIFRVNKRSVTHSLSQSVSQYILLHYATT